MKHLDRTEEASFQEEGARNERAGQGGKKLPLRQTAGGLRVLLGSLALMGLLLFGGCASNGGDQAASSSSSSSSGAAEEETAFSCALAGDNFSNLQQSDPRTPVYDNKTLAMRRQQGLTTTLPELKPYREGRVAYLTFDDGPDDKNTPAILDILKENGVTATFYVTGQHAELHPDVLKRIFAEHHAIGNHSYDHKYEKLYPSVQGFLAEMEKTDDIIYGILGVRPLILRAPGGVIGNFTSAYAPALKANGYVEHDWNISSADAAPNHPVAQDFIDNIDNQTNGAAVQHTAIILMHSSEGHEETVKALPEIIRILKAKGYTFGVITPMTPQPW
ncbi:polysaccharide deacetylase family protein [uncultured Mitsuokella sp.]|uniref:polysaccharide deacetylase family protein n=1 Tax=uncultured Mitsuokella sp. TaxID=453120 RepID=UPI0026198FAF|nr:polysaccharide deacetylase family protein [uncultured Mitsuokella sp.]